jgi:hypothetical protein
MLNGLKSWGVFLLLFSNQKMTAFAQKIDGRQVKKLSPEASSILSGSRKAMGM